MSAPKVLIIGWDAADWKIATPLIDSGQMPHLARFIEEGVMGDITTLQPVLSPMLWNSIGTGMLADRHNILGFTEVDPTTGGIRPVTSTSRRVKALWNILTQQGLRTHVVHWFGGHPAEPINGVCVSDAFSRGAPAPGKDNWPLLRGTIHPPELAENLARLRVSPLEIDGDMIRMFVPRAAEIDQEKDKRLLMLAKLEAECYSIHAVATEVMARFPWDFMAVYYPSIDHFCHGFINYHPPKANWVTQRDFDLFHDVVNSAYRFHDMMLGRLLQIAGPEATVILLSDHGFHSDHLRPDALLNTPAAPAEQHRPLGIFAMKGPPIRRDERVYGLSLLDIAPTVLAVYGLPAGRDMPGRVISEAFVFPPALDRIASWEESAGAAGMHAVDEAMPEHDAKALIEQFVDLGYIEKPDEDQQKAVETTLRERKWNLARVYTSTGRFPLALPLLEEIFFETPERLDFAMALANCQIRLGLNGEARETAEASLTAYRETPIAHWVLAVVEEETGDPAKALEHLRQAEAAAPNTVEILLRIAQVHQKRRRWEEAQAAYEKVIALDPHHAAAHEGLARCHLRLRRFTEAAEAALTAVGFQHQLPRAHLILGVALARLGKVERSIQALETALSFPYPLRAAHAWLHRLHTRRGDRQQAWKHFEAAAELRRRQVLKKDQLDRIRAEAKSRAEARAALPPKPAREPEPLAPHKPGKRPAKDRGPALDFILVSGLPRSGTSLAMQMLHAAGIPIMTDAKRQADSDNPEGYFEWEEIKKIRRRPDILRKAEGKAIKVISMLIPHLPQHHNYKVIFMDRPIEEVAASHRKMLANLGKGAKKENENLAANLEKHRQAVLDHIRGLANFELLVLDYPKLVADAAPAVTQIKAFLARPDLDAAAMQQAIRPSLYRNKR